MAQLSQDDEGFRIHIRTLLCRYAEAYLTCDHRQWTEKTVAELLAEGLRKVPIVDPTSLWIQPEPFDTLQRLYNLSQLSSYKEHFLTNASALVYVKDASKNVQREIRSDRAALVEGPNPPPCEGMEEAVLTTRAIRNTPKLPSGAVSDIVQRGPFYLSEGVKLVENEEPDQAPLRSDEILNVNWQTTTSECRQEVQAALKRMLDLSGRVPSHLQAQLDSDKFNTQIYRPDSLFIPLFPRKTILARKSVAAGIGNELKSLAELSAYLPPEISTEKLDKDLFNDNMRVIDDWGSFMISSPSTLSTPSSSQVDSKIDMLFNNSSPNTVLSPTEALEAAKMEIVQIPRSRRQGCANVGKLIADDDRFASFMLKTIHETREPIETRQGTHGCLQKQISSMAGEAPCSETTVASMTVDEADTDDDLCKLYANESIKDFWSWETLDETDTMLMEVPNLLPPNIHGPGNTFLSSKFSDFCLESKNTAALPQFLKKVKGLQPLQIALSWKAFTTDGPLPSHAEMAGVSLGFTVCDSEIGDVSARAVRRLTEGTKSGEASDIAVGLGTTCLFREMHDEARHDLSGCGPDMILTRRERCRQAKAIRDGGEFSQVGTNKEREIGSEFRNSGASDPIIIQPKLTPNPLANESTNIDINGACIQHLTTLPKVEERRSDAFLGLEAARRIWNGTGADMTEDHHQIHAPITSDTGWHETSIRAFVGLRCKSLSTCSDAVALPKIEQRHNSHASAAADSSGPRLVPSDIFTRTTLQLPSRAEQPIARAVHHYLASLDALQKQVWVRALREPDCSVKLVERDNLGGPDLIVDPFTAILYRSLFSLPSECDDLIGLVSKLSWSFERLIIVLEAFPPAHAARSTDQANVLFAYTPPILKAIKKLRRGVDMVEADQEKRPETIVLYAFPDTVQEAAVITRYIGDLTQALDQTDGALWEDRSWLENIEEDEENLANAVGMNRFTSAIVLSQTTLDEFIAMSPDQRHRAFSPFIGTYAIASFNADLENRITQSSSDGQYGNYKDPHPDVGEFRTLECSS